MLVVTFALNGANNCVVVDDVPYVYARTIHGNCLLPARCPHRGGPLHLARVETDRPMLVCPWHQGRTSILRLVRKGVPVVRRGNQVTAVFPQPEATPHHLSYRPMSKSLS